jgi:serine/threonine protein kinase
MLCGIMALEPGTTLGHYEIRALIGVGEVYRARDTKLDRDVAIKVLPEAFARDAERIARSFTGQMLAGVFRAAPARK